ncbi:MAG: P-loop NTPase [Bacteriovoracaceae bacterium]|nr:P-loop NTPase [Bacteriovoracaceae bacterium]
MKIVIASGKGGTGKTTIAVNLAYYLSDCCNKKVRLLDCDVEGPNDNLFVGADFTENFEVTAPRPVWDESSCTGCGKCTEICKYNAIAKVKDKILIFNELCHSCGACSYLCPEKALPSAQVGVGRIQLSPSNKPFYFGHGILNIGESLAPMVVKKLKENCSDDSINIIDASPGTACSVVMAMKDSDIAILVTEPTPFGLNDLELAASLTAQMKIPTGVVINRSYGDDGIIENFCKQMNIPVICKVPFDRKYAEVYSSGGILVREFPDLHKIFSRIYEGILNFNNISPPIVINKTNISSTTAKPPVPRLVTNHHYKELVVISGKGGTGKTTVVGSIAELMDNKILADGDVDAANLHLLLRPVTFEEKDFVGGDIYSIDPSSCNGCGLCEKVCHYGAVKTDKGNSNEISYRIDEMSCEGCGFCSEVCPTNSISGKESISGKWFMANTDYGLMSHAKLGIGAENSGKLVTKVRENASKLAEEYQADYILNDGPPGTGCPVIASITGANMVLIVTEPTVSGVHDMERVLELSRHFGIKTVTVINKADLNADQTQRIKEVAKQYNSKVIGEIPFDKDVYNALIAGKTVLAYSKGAASVAIKKLWTELKREFA